jgi:hypothetical protein
MRKLFGLFLVLALALPVWPQEPSFGWKIIGAETLSLDATEPIYRGLPSGQLRFEFQAEEAVYIGVLTPQQYAAVSGKYLMLTQFAQFYCVRTSIIEATEECNVGISNAVLAIRDKRGPIIRVAGAYSTVKPMGGSATLADRASKPNKVKVTIYQWACMENCPN